MRKIILFITGVLSPQPALCNHYDTVNYAYTDLTTVNDGATFTEKMSSSFYYWDIGVEDKVVTIFNAQKKFCLTVLFTQEYKQESDPCDPMIITSIFTLENPRHKDDSRWLDTPNCARCRTTYINPSIS